jgi:hypothetical protein
MEVKDYLGTIVQRMGAPIIELEKLSWESLDPFDLDDKLRKEGIDVPWEVLQVLPNGTFEYYGRKIVVYIREQLSGKNFNYRFHIMTCGTLMKAQRQGWYNKYSIAKRTDGIFNINEIHSRSNTSNLNDIINRFRSNNKDVHLDVCKNCLHDFNYKDYNFKTKLEKENIFNNFSINEFFEFCENTGIKSPIIKKPLYTETTAPINDYPSDWAAISNEQKRIKNYTCEECKIMLINNPKFLHTHHKDECKRNNQYNNLQVLCIACHANKPKHSHLRSTPDFMEFNNKKCGNNLFWEGAGNSPQIQYSHSNEF